MIEWLNELKIFYQTYGSYSIYIICIAIELKFQPIRKFYNALDLVKDISVSHGKLQEKIVELQSQVNTDITEIKTRIETELKDNGGSSMKDALRRTESLLTQLSSQYIVSLDFHEHGIFMCNSEGKNYYVNRTFTRNLLCGKDELLNYNWQNFIIDNGDFSNKLRTALQFNREFAGEVQFKSVDGSIHDAKIEAAPLNGTGGGYLGYIIFK